MAGTYISSTSSGVVLSNPSTQNPATVVAGAYVTNTTTLISGDGIYATPAAAWRLTNLGTIKTTAATSDGVLLREGGIITNSAGALISGAVFGAYVGGGVGTVINSGTIVGTGTAAAGVGLRGGGTITNSAGALISAVLNAAYINGGIGIVTNSGTIAGTRTAGAGVVLKGGGTVTNSAGGLISGVVNVCI